MSERNDYVFDETNEHRRLRSQSTVFDPITSRLFTEAGLAAGMRVLDLGSGAGNVAMLASQLVGPHGSVVGIERDPESISAARHWAEAAGRDNIEYVEGDVTTLGGVDGEFDAVVGRTILVHLADPKAVLRAAIGRLRAGGLLCMQEVDLTHVWAQPETPLWKQIRRWVVDTCSLVGVDYGYGRSLFSVLGSLGLSDVRLSIEASGGGGERSVAFAWAEAVAGILPAMERLGIASADEVGIGDLEQRLDAELDAQHGFSVSPLVFGAWTHLPE